MAKSGSDEVLDDHDREEDEEEDEDILTKNPIVRHVSTELNLLSTKATNSG